MKEGAGCSGFSWPAAADSLQFTTVPSEYVWAAGSSTVVPAWGNRPTEMEKV